MDLLSFLRGGNQDFMRIHCYLGVVSVYIVFFYSMMYPTTFDYTTEKALVGAMHPDWDRKFCVEAQPEYHYRKCLWVMIVAHFIAYVVSYFYTFLNANYREINQEGFEMTKTYQVFTLSAFAAFAVCTGLAFWLETIV